MSKPREDRSRNDSNVERRNRIEEHARRVEREDANSTLDLREVVASFLRQLQASDVEELNGSNAEEHRLLTALVAFYDRHRDEWAAGESVRATGTPLAQPIDAVELEAILGRYQIEDHELDSVGFARRTLQVSVRRNQRLMPAGLADLCESINAILRERADGCDPVVTEADLRPVCLLQDRIRTLVAGAGFASLDEFLRAANRRALDEYHSANRKRRVEPKQIEIASEQFNGGGTVTLQHFQARAVAAALGVAPQFLLNESKPGEAIAWLKTAGLDALAERIYQARRHQDGGFRIIPYRDPADNPTQAYTTAECTTALLALGHSQSRPLELQRALEFLAKTRVEYAHDGRSICGWPYFHLSSGKSSHPVADVAGWVVVTEASALRANLWSKGKRVAAQRRLDENIDHLLAQQAPSGGFVPIPSVDDRYARTYTTVMAVWALAESMRSTRWSQARRNHVGGALERALNWLWEYHLPVVGFTPDPVSNTRVPFFPGLHCQCLAILAWIRRLIESGQLSLEPRAVDGDLLAAPTQILVDWLVTVRPRFEQHNMTIDMYCHFRDSPFLIEMTRHLWGPWAFASLHHLAALGMGVQAEMRDHVAAAFLEYWHAGGRHEYGRCGTYELAEALYCFALVLEDKPA